MAALNKQDIVAIIGAGTMGAGMAQVAAAAGHTTLLYDMSRDAVDRGITNTAKGLNRLVERGKMSEEQRDTLLSNIKPAGSLEDLADAKLVIEAIVENLEVKRDLFSKLEEICSDETILATNTSSLSVTAIAAPLKRPGNLVGMHFFNPAPIMKLVEIISGVTTDQAIAETVFDTANNWGKHAVYAKSTPGFIVNRVARPYYAEGLRALEEGATDAATLDAILRESGGFRMGPFELMDLIGHDVNYAVTSSVFSAFYNDSRFLPSLIQKELVDGGLLGRKSGRGFFDYAEGAQKPEPQTADTCKGPSSIKVVGDLGVADTLIKQWEAAGIQVTRSAGDANCILTDGVCIALSDGRSATRRAAENNQPNTILFDLALDYTKAARIAITKADQASSKALDTAIGLFQKLDKQISVIDDIPGMIVMRTVCTLANEASDAVLLQVCDVDGADTAMCSGVNYPKGPLAWADSIGLSNVLEVLEQLQNAYGLDRYRPSQLLRRLVDANRFFHQ